MGSRDELGLAAIPLVFELPVVLLIGEVANLDFEVVNWVVVRLESSYGCSFQRAIADTVPQGGLPNTGYAGDVCKWDRFAI